MESDDPLMRFGELSVGDSGFLAVGVGRPNVIDEKSAYALYSRDASSWVLTRLPHGDGSLPFAVAWSAIGFAVGAVDVDWAGPDRFVSGATWRTNSGVDWSFEQVPDTAGLLSGSLLAVTEFGSGYVVVGEGFQYAGLVAWQVSAAGSWGPPADLPGPHDDGYPPQLHTLGNTLVLVGVSQDQRRTSWTSTDGVTWRTHDLGDGDYWAGSTVDNGRLIVAGRSCVWISADCRDFEARLWTTDDGTNWTSLVAPDVAGDGYVEDVVVTPSGLWIATGQYGGDVAVWTSNDGNGWLLSSDVPGSAALDPGARDLTSVALKGDNVIALSRGLELWTGTIRPVARVDVGLVMPTLAP